MLKDYTGDSLDSVPLLYQTGYLAITDYDSKKRRYTLGFPNEEVKYGFLESMMPSFVPMATVGNKMDILTLDEYIENRQLDKVRDLLPRYSPISRIHWEQIHLSIISRL